MMAPGQNRQKYISMAGWILLTLTALHLLAVIIATSTTGSYSPRTSYIGVVLLGPKIPFFAMVSVLLGIGQAVAYYLLLRAYRNRIFYAGILNGITIVLISIFNMSYSLVYYLSLYSNFAFLGILILGLAYFRLIRSQFRYFGTAMGLILMVLLALIVAGSTGLLGSGGTENLEVYLIHFWGIAYGAYLIGDALGNGSAYRRENSIIAHYTGWAGILLLSMTMIFVGALISASSLYPNYSPRYQYIDALGLGATAHIYNPGLFLFGIGIIGAFYLLLRVYRSWFFTIWGIFGGTSAVFLSIFNKTFGGINTFWVLTTLIAMTVAAIYAYRILKPRFNLVILVLGLTMLVALISIMTGNDLGLGGGGIERMVLYPLFIWVAAFGAYLIGNGGKRIDAHGGD